jgi:rubrerythrin
MQREQRLGVGRVLRELGRLWEEEASEVAYRLARADYLAERGEEQAAALLREVAMSELRHLVLVTRLHDREGVERDPVAMFAGMVEADRNAVARAEEMAETARKVGLEEEASLFACLAEDERGHVARLEEALALLRR